jgi:DNA-binding IclR family transcriptional regulator
MEIIMQYITSHYEILELIITVTDNKTIYSVQSVERTFSILETVSHCENGIRVKDLAVEVGLNLSTTHRLVSLLEQMGYVEQEPETKKYYLGLKVLELQGFLFKRMRLADLAAQELKSFVHETGETTHLAVLSDGEVVYIESFEGIGSIISRASIGKKASIHSTALGKVLTAWLPWAEVELFLQRKTLEARTPQTITDNAAYREALDYTRQAGYALDLQENSMATCCVAAPIRDHRGEVVAAVSVSCPFFDFNEEKKQMIVKKLLQCVARISVKMGFKAV